MKDNSIGGFIELEFYSGKAIYHPKAIALANGRACFHLFLKEYKPSKVFIPFYTCNTLIEPLLQTNTPYEFYSLDKNLEPVLNPTLKSKEYLLYINYFDIKNKAVLKLEKLYGNKLVVDNTHAFFQKNYAKASVSFNSSRKFFGVPDGGYLYMQKKIKENYPENTHFKTDHLFSRFLSKSDIYYKQFLENEHAQRADITSMSGITKKILSQVDYDYCIKKRLENFDYLHKLLSKHNTFKIDKGSIGVPYIYPFLPVKHIDRTKFYKKNIFISTFWKDVLERKNKDFSTEKHLSEYLLPLPVDQRYGKKEMKIIADILISHL